MKQTKLTFAVMAATLVAVAGCAIRPMGPSVAVMPGPNKSFEMFQQDQTNCKQFADQQVTDGPTDKIDFFIG